MNTETRSKVLERLKLPDPVSVALRAAQGSVSSEAQRARDWVDIAARLDAHSRRRRFVRMMPVLAWGAAFVMGALFVVGALFFGFKWSEPEFAKSAGPNVAAVTQSANVESFIAPPRSDIPPDLRLVGGAEFRGLTASGLPTASTGTDSFAAQAKFEDGSSLTALTSDAVVEPLAMTERDVMLRLVSGAIDVHVVKGGRRRWIVEAGVLSVEVVGTRFVVSRTAERASVAVTEGIVLTRSSRLPDGVRRLTAGARLEITAEAAAPLAASGSPEVLLERADAARQSGDLRAARSFLQRLVRAFPQDARAGVAAFQLAIVTQQLGAPPEQVVAAFEQALRKARGRSLREDCYWRLVLALEHAGRYEPAAQRARESVREYPNGRYAAELRRRLVGASGEGAR